MFNLGDMMNRIREMQDKLKSARERLEHLTTEAESGAGMVRVTANANRRVLKIKIDPDIMDKNDPEILEDLVAAAVNKAIEQAEALGRQELQRATEGMMPQIPGFDLDKMGFH